MKTQLVSPGSFHTEKHWYEKAHNATIHPLVKFFLNLSTERIVERYCHLNPQVRKAELYELLAYVPEHFVWGGADLIKVTTPTGKRQLVVIENNSCPSGQKSMPLTDDAEEQGGYKQLIQRTFLPILKSKRGKVEGGQLAVLYDKNPMECSGYAAAIADLTQEKVWLVPYHSKEEEHVRFTNKTLEVRNPEGQWVPIRVAFRYVTQRPWDRIPMRSKTKFVNPILSCLAGGRNKLLAAKAYDIYNSEIEGAGLRIQTPATEWSVSKAEVPLWVQRMGGHAVVKVPYSNAGQGVFTIINQQELDRFMAMDFHYDQFIVQSLIGNMNWSSTVSKEKFYHVGMVPNLKGETFVFDLRMMISKTESGLRPLCIYSRRAHTPLKDKTSSQEDSWAMLGTNLSVKEVDGGWSSETARLMLMDNRDFNKLGLSLDDLIEGFIQTVLSTIAIDKMAKTLLNKKGEFRMRLFRSLVGDESLLKELEWQQKD